jgi:hypothetical protein
MQPRIMSRDVKSTDGPGAAVRLAARDEIFQMSDIAMPVGVAVGYVHAHCPPNGDEVRLVSFC